MTWMLMLDVHTAFGRLEHELVVPLDRTRVYLQDLIGKVSCMDVAVSLLSEASSQSMYQVRTGELANLPENITEP